MDREKPKKLQNKETLEISKAELENPEILIRDLLRVFTEETERINTKLEDLRIETQRTSQDKKTRDWITAMNTQMNRLIARRADLEARIAKLPKASQTELELMLEFIDREENL